MHVDHQPIGAPGSDAGVRFPLIMKRIEYAQDEDGEEVVHDKFCESVGLVGVDLKCWGLNNHEFEDGA